MPKNNNLTPVKLPMEIRFNETPTTKFINNLHAISLDLISAPTMQELRRYLPEFLEATWAEQEDIGHVAFTNEGADKIIRQCLEGKALPTALETVKLTFRLNGISMQEVTHILRYRTASFSADCSGDKWWTHKDALIPNAIQHSNGNPNDPSSNFHERYKQLVRDAKQLYCDMIDSKKISIMDARYILPRCLSTFYYMSISLKDAIHFIKQRIDKQIQPETDNLIAYYMYIELCKVYPVMIDLIDIHQPSWFYMNMARTGKATNLYFPDEDSDKFEWNEDDFIYQCRRDELNGTDENAINLFNGFLQSVEYQLNLIKEEYLKQYR